MSVQGQQQPLRRPWQTIGATWLDCATAGIQAGILLVVVPNLYWTTWRDGVWPFAARVSQLGGPWNHDLTREEFLDFIVSAALLAVVTAIASLVLNSARIRGRVLAAVSIAVLLVLLPVYIGLVD